MFGCYSMHQHMHTSISQNKPRPWIDIRSVYWDFSPVATWSTAGNIPRTQKTLFPIHHKKKHLLRVELSPSQNLLRRFNHTLVHFPNKIGLHCMFFSRHIIFTRPSLNITVEFLSNYISASLQWQVLNSIICDSQSDLESAMYVSSDWMRTWEPRRMNSAVATTVNLRCFTANAGTSWVSNVIEINRPPSLTLGFWVPYYAAYRARADTLLLIVLPWHTWCVSTPQPIRKSQWQTRWSKTSWKTCGSLQSFLTADLKNWFPPLSNRTANH